MVEAHLDVSYPEKDRYRIFLDAKTRGFLGALAPWEGTFESAGWRLKGDPPLRPEMHESVATWRGTPDIKEYRYTKDGGFVDIHITEDRKPRKKHSVKDEITQGTTDAFTAGLIVMEDIAAGGKCEGSAEVFDGKRRFEQIFKDAGTEDLTANSYNIYSGPTSKCTIEIKPISGEWSKKPRGWLSIQEQGRDKGTLPTVWMGQFSEGGPALPVKILVKTSYGTLIMHAIKHTEE